VNVEGAWDQGKPTYLREYVDRASAWVQAAGDRVQYWEIGNEAYHCGGPPRFDRQRIRPVVDRVSRAP
jgi:hypothetical protein